jgi:translation elongation factor aEF-1 beta
MIRVPSPFPAQIVERQSSSVREASARMWSSIPVQSAASLDQTEVERMGKVIITFKIMPQNPEVNLETVQKTAEEKIDAFVGETAEKKVAIEPVAFGLKSLNITFVSDEEKGTTDEIESQIGEIEGVQSCEVTDVRRALG